MAENEKLKILYVMRILLEETDADHKLSAVELCERLESEYGISSNRKTIYGDIDKLREFGLLIDQQKGSHKGYYIEKRIFELPELKLLVDAVQASNFITVKKSEELIRKLEQMTTRDNASKLQRQVFIYNRPKTYNETIYAGVDAIHRAMADNRKILFKYCYWTSRKKLERKHGGADYHISPWALTWDDENYYMVGYDAQAGKIKHYRVDKMQEVRVSPDRREGREQFEHFDLAAFAKKTFGMYGGTDTAVTLRCSDDLAGVMIDRFGQEIMMMPDEKGYFRVVVTVSVSGQFFGWIAGLGQRVQIIRPENVREQYEAYLRGILSVYETKS